VSKSIHHPHSLRYVSIALGFFMILIGSANLYSQTSSGCAKTDQSNQAWAQNTTVYYDTSKITDAQAKQQIESGIAAWDSANKNDNYSGVRFLPGPAPAGAPTITFQMGGSNANNAGHTDTTVNLSNGIIQSATVSFYTDGKTPGGNPIYDKNQPGYYDMFLKVTLHEIGHTMGLEDADVPTSGYCDQPDGATVMNGYCGTNDSGGNLSKTVTSCDNTALKSADSPYPPPMPTGGGGGGVGGGGDYYYGGGGGYCTPYYWVYYESYDGGNTWYEVDSEYAGCW
jgi:hypothetical protein